MHRGSTVNYIAIFIHTLLETSSKHNHYNKMKHITLFSILLALVLGTFMACQPQKYRGKGTPPDATDVPLPEANEQQMDALFAGLDAGGPITLEPLTYYLDNTIVIRESEFPFSLDGNGCAFVMRNKDANVFQILGANKVALRNFKATHIEPNGPIGCLGSVISVEEAASVLIENCELNGSGIIGVVAYDTENLRIINNYIYNNSNYGVLYDTLTTLEIIDNRFEDNGEDGTAHVGAAQNATLSRVIRIDGDQNQEGLKMAGNTYK